MAEPMEKNVIEQAQICADKLIKKSHAVLGVHVRVNVRGRIDYPTGVAVVEDQQKLRGVMVDALDLANKLGDKLRIESRGCNMTIVVFHLEDVSVAVAYKFADEIAKSLRRMVERTTRKLVDTAKEANA